MVSPSLLTTIAIALLSVTAEAAHHHGYQEQAMRDAEGYLERRDGNVVLDGFKSGMTNAQQRLDAFVLDLKSSGARPGSAAAVHLITGLDGQIDNVLGVIGNALSPITGGLSNAAISVILGPTFQSLTDGAEVLLGNVVGGALDIALVPATRLLSNNLSNLSHVALRYDMKPQSQKFAQYSNKFNQLINVAIQHDAAKHHPKGKRLVLNARALDTAGAASSAMGSVKRSIDKLIENLGDSTEPDAVNAYSVALDQQVDSGLMSAHDAVQKIELHDSAKQAMFAPLFQSAVKGAEVLFTKTNGNPVDPGVSPSIAQLSSDLVRLARFASDENMPQNAETISAMATKLQNVASNVANKSKRSNLHARQADIVGGVMSGLTNAEQRMDAFVHDLRSGNARPGSQAMVNLITGLDGQIDNLLGVIGSGLAPLTGGLSNAVISVILGPSFQSLTDGVEVLLGNVGGGVLDIALVPAMHLLAGNLMNVANVAGNYDMKEFVVKFNDQAKRVNGYSLKAQQQHAHQQHH
ncbi:hypothetical protein TRVA0_006S03356 [Trichomonascus vanleenenianus]|uniref:uncharacterized protein n=1 Tax=Trichomonascus vanleenenianus TaxID=2268995 RepID=UPI003ECB81DF